jgi:hypothetical protein
MTKYRNYKKHKNIMEFGFENDYVSGSHPTNVMSLYYLKFSYNLETLVSSQYKYKKTRNCNKERTTKEHSRLKRKRFETNLKEV